MRIPAFHGFSLDLSPSPVPTLFLMYLFQIVPVLPEVVLSAFSRSGVSGNWPCSRVSSQTFTIYHATFQRVRLECVSVILSNERICYFISDGAARGMNHICTRFSNGLVFRMGEVPELWHKTMVNNCHVFKFEQLSNCIQKVITVLVK